MSSDDVIVVSMSLGDLRFHILSEIKKSRELEPGIFKLGSS
jgi:hypothetical protein